MKLSTETVEALLCAAAASWAEEIIAANPRHQPGWAVDQIPAPCAAVLIDLWVSGQRHQLQLLWSRLVEHCVRTAARRGQIPPTNWDLAAGLRDVVPPGCDDWELTRFLVPTLGPTSSAV